MRTVSQEREQRRPEHERLRQQRRAQQKKRQLSQQVDKTDPPQDRNSSDVSLLNLHWSSSPQKSKPDGQDVESDSGNKPSDVKTYAADETTSEASLTTSAQTHSWLEVELDRTNQTQDQNSSDMSLLNLHWSSIAQKSKPDKQNADSDPGNKPLDVETCVFDGTTLEASISNTELAHSGQVIETDQQYSDNRENVEGDHGKKPMYAKTYVVNEAAPAANTEHEHSVRKVEPVDQKNADNSEPFSSEEMITIDEWKAQMSDEDDGESILWPEVDINNGGSLKVSSDLPPEPPTKKLSSSQKVLVEVGQISVTEESESAPEHSTAQPM